MMLQYTDEKWSLVSRYLRIIQKSNIYQTMIQVLEFYLLFQQPDSVLWHADVWLSLKVDW